MRHKAAREVIKCMDERKMLTAEYGKCVMKKLKKKKVYVVKNSNWV